jgi:hypothetical protein
MAYAESAESELCNERRARLVEGTQQGSSHVQWVQRGDTETQRNFGD